MRIRFSVEIADADVAAVAVVVHHSLVAEAGIVILGVELQGLACQRNVESRAHAIVPCLLLFEVV